MRYFLFIIFLFTASIPTYAAGTNIDLNTACALRSGSYPYSISFALWGKEIVSDKWFIITKNSIFLVHQGQSDRYLSFYECEDDEAKLIDRREISPNLNIDRVLQSTFILLKTTESTPLTLWYYNRENKELFEIESARLLHQAAIKKYLQWFKLQARITSIREGKVRVEISRIKKWDGIIYRYGKKVFVVE